MFLFYPRSVRPPQHLFVRVYECTLWPSSIFQNINYYVFTYSSSNLLLVVIPVLLYKQICKSMLISQRWCSNCNPLVKYDTRFIICKLALMSQRTKKQPPYNINIWSLLNISWSAFEENYKRFRLPRLSSLQPQQTDPDRFTSFNQMVTFFVQWVFKDRVWRDRSLRNRKLHPNRKL